MAEGVSPIRAPLIFFVKLFNAKVVRPAMDQPINIFWFRRDLRLEDNAALWRALKDKNPVVPIFVFDRNILDKLDDTRDPRVTFIFHTIKTIQEELRNHHSALEVFYGFPDNAFRSLLEKYRIEKVFANHDYEPYATERDEVVRKLLNDNNVSFHTSKDQVIFEKSEIARDDGSPYVVFTPYSRKWLEKLDDFYLKPYPAGKYFSHFYHMAPMPLPSLESMGFKDSGTGFPPIRPDKEVIQNYAEQRDYPGIDGTSRMGIHLRFGTVSIRRLAALARTLSDVYLKELIWREFYMMVLWNFPKVGRGEPFKKPFEYIEWRNNEEEFRLWCEGRTGYPIVDAGMRQLNQTGFMHNRVRMIVASFLAKHLLIDWRWGETYFAEKLLDYELASNNGGWQWAAGSGCDAVPYFRMFNPSLQAKKFDPQFTYISEWVPEFQEFGYPEPIVDHEFARKRFLEVYNRALKSGS